MSFCRPECAIENPDNVITFEGRSEPRSVVFGNMRSHIAYCIAGGGSTTLDPAESEEAGKLFMVAEACVDRIRAGNCGKFFVNTMQYPNQPAGLMSYEAAEQLTSEAIREGE